MLHKQVKNYQFIKESAEISPCDIRSLLDYDKGRVREGSEATRYFGVCRNCGSLAVVVVAHFDPHLAGHHLDAKERADDCSCRF